MEQQIQYCFRADTWCCARWVSVLGVAAPAAVADGLGVLWAVVWAGGEHGCAVSSLYSGGRSGELLLALNLGRVADDRE